MTKSAIRTCCGCGKTDEKSKMLRLVAAGKTATPDPDGRMSGRGAYLHLAYECFYSPSALNGIRRALKQKDVRFEPDSALDAVPAQARAKSDCIVSNAGSHLAKQAKREA